MATIPLTKGTANLSVNVPLAMREQLRSLARASQCSVGEYIRRVLAEAIRDGVTWEMRRQSAADASTLPPCGGPKA